MTLESDLVEIDEIVDAKRDSRRMYIVTKPNCNPYMQIREVLNNHEIAIDGTDMDHNDTVTLRIASPDAAESWFDWFER